MARVISLELNELNVDLVTRYSKEADLPGFKRLLETYPRSETVAESVFEHVEPWIQWVSVHTGLNYEEHGVFRLGDIVATDYPQIWEVVQREHGATVAAVSPMNARTEVADSPFFLPDPWTPAEVRGPWHLKALHRGVGQAVNDNAEGRLEVGSAVGILAGVLRNVPISRYGFYVRSALRSRKGKWLKAGILDALLADVFISQWRRSKPDFSTLFLNAAAHVQHHYTFSSTFYDGPHRNPEWYVGSGVDPLADIYRDYDDILLRLFKLVDDEGVRLLVMNGLSQVPNPEVVHYYRPIDHATLMRDLGIQPEGIEPRMSRDFLLRFANEMDAAGAQARLEKVVLSTGDQVFSVDNRGATLFVKVAYTKELQPGVDATVDDLRVAGFASRLVHVSIENSIHSNRGLVIDTGATAAMPPSMPLPDVFKYVKAVVAQELR